MQIEYANVYLEQLCTDQKRAQTELGLACARKLNTYLSVLKAAPAVEDLPPIGHLHTLTGDRAGQKAFSLDKKMRLVFSSCLPEMGRNNEEDGKGSITIVCIEYIGNYHD